MNKVLRKQDIIILLAYISDPFVSITEIASTLGVTRTTARKRVESLKRREIIRSPIAVYSPYSLGLRRLNVIAHVDSLENLEKLVLACNEHPYTHYRTRLLGGAIGLFIQFDIPENTVALIETFLQELEQNNIIQNFTLYPSTGIRKEVYANIKRFNFELSRWDFTWENWFESLENESISLPEKRKINTNFEKFQANHFQILRMLTANSELMQTEIMEKLPLSRTQAHREYNYVMDNYVDSIRTIYNREIFNLTESYLLVAKDLSEKFIARLFSAMNNNPPPFRFALDHIENNQLICWGNFTSIRAINLAYKLWEVTDKVELYTLDTRFSRLYWFYPDNFDFQTHQWRISKDYVVDKPLKTILTS